ncbi:dehydrogenase/reductase 4 [Arctopsyche grandis]|uniref:dehydrogenase/reductase 4 n=1 Tax=Arctopsyche grandis TaxID=121162 RepID=UPI00406D63F2
MLRQIAKNLPPTYINLRTMSCSAGIPRDRLKGKVAIVTASTEGIGYAIAERLANEGASVLVSSRKEKNVTGAIDKLKKQGLIVEGVVCHVGKKEDRQLLFKTAVEKFGGLDILVSNAAVNPGVGPVLECDEATWDKIFDINVKSAYLLAQESLPHLRKRGGGSIVFVSSIAGLQPMPLLGAYSVSKTTLLGLIKAASIDLGPENIRVNCLAPGIVPTNFSSALTSDKTANEAILNTIPLRRFGKAEEMGATVAFLVSDDAGYITGETIVAAGGMPSRL